MNQNSNNDIVVDIDTWLLWLDSLNHAFPDVYNDPTKAVIGFYKDWEQYLSIVNKSRGV